jgi:TRAP transporter T-component
MNLRLFLIFLLILPFSGCFQQIAINSLGDLLDNGFAVLNEEPDLKIAETSIESDLKLLESVLRSNPQDEHYLLLACMGYSSYALGFVEDDDPQRASLFYRRGMDYGMQILKHNDKFARSLKKGPEEFQTSLGILDRDKVPAVFWTAIGWGSYISLNLTDPDAIADLPRVEAMMKYVLGIDSSYYYGGAYFFLGTIYGSRPQLLGGDTLLSRRYFNKSFEQCKERFLLPYVYFARTYAVQIQDRQLFEKTLSFIDSVSIDAFPQTRLVNAIAKKKAVHLRTMADELF